MAKIENKIDVLIDYWKKDKPQEGLELYKWQISLLTAIIEGYVGAEIQEGVLTLENMQTIEHNSKVYYMFASSDNSPEFYLKYKELLKINHPLDKNNYSVVLCVKKKEALTENIEIGSEFSYNKSKNELKDKDNKIAWKSENIYSEAKGDNQINPIYQLQSSEKIDENATFTLTNVSKSGATFYLTSPINDTYFNELLLLHSNEIASLKNYLKLTSDEEIENQECFYIKKNNIQGQLLEAEKKYKAAIKKEQRQEITGLTDEDEKQINKEKRDNKNDKKLQQEEEDRLNFFADYDVPTTITEFEENEDAMKCSDAAIGDVVLFSENVFGGSYRNAKFLGERKILGQIEKESYGKDRGQHTFSIYVIESKGTEPIDSGEKIRRLGRNMYQDCKHIQYATQETRDEKHNRGKAAKESKYWNWISEAENERKEYKLDKIPYSFIQENKDEICGKYFFVPSYYKL